MNAKVTFHEVFSDDPELPSVEACAEYVANDIGIDYATVLGELHKLDFDKVGKVDENMFFSLYYNVDHERPTTFHCEMSLCTSICDRCSRMRLSKDFLCSKSMALRTHCLHCRGDVPLTTHPKRIFSRIDMDSFDGERLAVIHLINMESAAATGKGIDCHYVQRGAPQRVESQLSSSNHYCHGDEAGSTSRSDIESIIREALFKAEGYRYTKSKSGSNSSRYVCAQRSDTARASLPEDSQRKRRKRETAKVESCGGVLVVKFGKEGETSISCFHEYLHESIASFTQMTPAVNQTIQRGAELGLSPFQIVAELNRGGRQHYTWGQVYYRWSLCMENMYKSCSDIKASARAFLGKSQQFKEILYTEEPFALGFLCIHARKICEEINVREAYIDSTFKTNSSKLELFGVLGSFLGTGFPVAYLLLEGSGRLRGSDGTTQRKSGVREFLKAVRRELRSFNPHFFFTDKDFGQIAAISSVYKIQPTICLWHMKRAIKRKVDLLRSEGVESITQDQKARILDVITEHFNSHPFFSSSSQTIESLYSKNLKEISDYCEGESLPKLFSYLLSNWYTWNRYLLWGRRNPAEIPFTRTTMTIESHWSLVKRQYLIHNNRPRIDFVLFILEQRLMPKIQADYTLLLRALKKPRWWKDFVREWDQAKRRPIEGSYRTNAGTWTCSCPYYLRSRFLFCKHLMSNMDCPSYRELVRNRHPPFLQFRTDPERHVPDMGQELRPLLEGVTIGGLPNRSLEFTECLPEEEENGRIRLVSKIEDLLQWACSHVADLRDTVVGAKQLDHIERNVLKRLDQYRERVEKSLRGRSAPKTWEHADTLFLP